MESAFGLADAQAYLRAHQLDGWLLEDFHQNNPLFWQIVGGPRHTTRRAFLFIGPTGLPRFLLHMIDVERLSDVGWPIEQYLSRADQDGRLAALLQGKHRVAMEYSPNCTLPVVGRVDAGTIEQVRGLGVEVVSSGDVLQYAVARWSPAQVESHRYAAEAVVEVARDAFAYIGRQLGVAITEYQVGEFIAARFGELGLVFEGGPDVAVNAHSSDPHYAATAAQSATIRTGDWVLIDLWAKRPTAGAVYGDATWVAHVGGAVDQRHQEVFDSVRRARDLALDFLSVAWRQGRVLEGWEVDRVARESIERDGFGAYFTHRLGHSLGERIHSNGVNLDGFETIDTRQVIPGVGVTVEPGIYLPEFGVRLEVDVYIDPRGGPTVTTPIQEAIITI
jgi:Xaa-Pro aminopeptidase